jgi:single-strand DNA-binding protein
MLNEAQIGLTGYVATQPMTKTVKSGLTNVSMRVAWTPRRQDRVTGEWVDGNTSYITVTCWRKLAANVAVCLRTGDPVIVIGKLSVRSYEDKGGIRRISADVDASTIGHDLSRGVSTFQRVRPQTGMTAAEYEAAKAAGLITAGPDGAGRQGGIDAADRGSAKDLSGEADGAVGRDDLADDEGWTPGGADMSAPDEAERAFFDESAISEDSMAPESVPMSS